MTPAPVILLPVPVPSLRGWNDRIANQQAVILTRKPA